MKIDNPGLWLWKPEVNSTPQPESSSPGFATVLKKVIQDADRQQVEADNQIQTQIISGKGDLHEVMLAIQKASLSFKFLTQLRNKLVQAYQEISRMPL